MKFDISEIDNEDVTGLGQRGIADLVEYGVSAIASKTNFGAGWEYFEPRSKRSPEDFALKHEDGRVIYYDVKTHDVDGEFCMPNLVSLDRARKIVQSDVDMIYIFVKYKVTSGILKIIDVQFIPLYKIAMSSIEIQNLGLGVLQIKNAHNPIDFYSESRDNWLQELNKKAIGFYSKQITKFERLRAQYE